MIPEAIGLRCGIDGRELWAHEALGGRLADLQLTEGRHLYVGWVRLLPPGSGRAAADVARLPDREGVLAAAGQRVSGEVIEVMSDPAGAMPGSAAVLFAADSHNGALRVATELSRSFAAWAVQP
jgi:hypothetical protein